MMHLHSCSFIALLVLCLSVASGHVKRIHNHEHLDLPGSRIIGGKKAPLHAAPFLVALKLEPLDKPGYVRNCAGTLITNQHILTAAHCVNNTGNNRIIMGTNTMSYDNEEHVEVAYNADFIMHNGFVSDVTKHHDIALMKLQSPLTKLDQYINKTTIPKVKGPVDQYDGKVGRIYGWGVTHDPPPQPKSVDELRYVDVKVIPNGQCLFPNVWDGHICTSSRAPQDSHIVGHCRGDSGGPLMIDNVAVGVISFSGTLCTGGLPSVYTRVDYYLDWIQYAMRRLG